MEINFFRQQLEPSKSMNEGSVSDRMGSIVSSTRNSRPESHATKSVIGSPTGSSSNPRRKSSTSKGTKNVLNEANLRELQAQIDPIAEYFCDMKVAMSAIEESKKARAGRRIKMLNSLQQLPNLF